MNVAARPTLYEDIYEVIFDIIEDQWTVSAMMRTCTTLYTLGVKYLLSFEVIIDNVPSLNSFGQFMLRDLGERARYLWSLDVVIEFYWIGDIGESESPGSADSYQQVFNLVDDEELLGAHMLVEIIRAASALDTLRIDYCELLLSRNNDLISAIAGLPALRHLHLTSFGTRTLDICQTITAPLVEVKVDCFFDGCESAEMCGITDMFHAQRLTLEKLTARYVDLTEPFVELGVDTIQFPNVHSLCLSCSYVYSLPVLSHVFPRLRVLQVYDTDDWGGDVEADELHEANAASLSPSWPALEHLSGDIKALYMLNIPCPADRVDIIMGLDDDAADQLDELIESTRPTHLGLHIGFRPEDVYAADHNLLGYLLNISAEALERLTSLVIDLHRPDVAAQYTHSLVNLVARVSPTCLLVRVNDDYYDPELEDQHKTNSSQTAASYGADPSSSSSAQSLWSGHRFEDPRKRARRDLLTGLASTSLHLAFVCFDYQDEPIEYFYIFRPLPGTFTCRQLDPREGKALVDQQGLRWPPYPGKSPRSMEFVGLTVPGMGIEDRPDEEYPQGIPLATEYELVSDSEFNVLQWPSIMV
ncbi:hypothetical protein BV20DRAFT_967906 [Pilatotrama ljubarskyi]|nr:hypothetical protein BV20DRAFT_967906 [Pilatotrama ljubarskyi]